MFSDQSLHYADCLQQILIKRISIIPTYSLRAFARDTGIHPSALSRILNRKQSISLKSAISITQTLGLSDSKNRVFLDLVVGEKLSDMKDLVFEKLGLRL